MRTRPRVSVLVPTYNYACYLPEAIDSVLAQSFKDYELIIVDDASQDDSRSVLEAYRDRDQRIRLRFNETNRGMVQNWNDCLSMARGTYIKYLFGDDRLAHPETLALFVRKLEHRDSVRLVGSARELIDESSRRTGIWSYGDKDEIRRGHRVIADCVFRQANLIGEPSAVMFRRQDAERGFNLDFRQLVDLEMWLHLLERGNYAYVAAPFCSFRQHAKQQTEVNRRAGVHNREMLMLVQKYLELPVATKHSMRWSLFKLCYRLQKGISPEDDRWELIDTVKRTLGRQRYAYYVGYKLSRPFVNLVHSLRKRLPRKTAGSECGRAR